jgi:ATP phosphoribosyltransferase
MKNVLTAEAITAANQVLLPNRYGTPFTEAYQEITGREVPTPDGRKASITSQGVLYRFVSGRDIPNLVTVLAEAGPTERTVGVTGSEWFSEYWLENYGARQTELRSLELQSHKFGEIALIAPPNVDRSEFNSKLGGRWSCLDVVTPYPNLVNGLRIADRLSVRAALTVSGSVEPAAEMLGMAAIDLVCTGNTVRENGFSVMQSIWDVYPVFVAAEADS